jgi:glycogen synthase
MVQRSEKPKILFASSTFINLCSIDEHAGSIAHIKYESITSALIDLIDALCDHGVDVHVALPYFKSIYNNKNEHLFKRELEILKEKLPADKIHFAKDRAFYYLNQSNLGEFANIRNAILFQREVINNIEPRVLPDIIHCHGWMTGIITAFAHQISTPCIFSFSKVINDGCILNYIEDQGIDAASFWQQLYYRRMPINYEETRESNPVDFLLTGIFAADHIIAQSPDTCKQVERSLNGYPKNPMRRLIEDKYKNGFVTCYDGSICSNSEFFKLYGKILNKVMPDWN